MDKLTKLKCQLIEAYSALIRKAQKGYPIADYKVIKEGMLAVNYIENFTLPPNEVITIIDKFSYALNLKS